ncbi:hypothetical protein BU196_29095 [Streptomyces sp. CBMA370]|nr:hypothetical protein [Streptomyces sp. CBMA370]
MRTAGAQPWAWGNSSSKEARSRAPWPGPRQRRAASWTRPLTRAARRRTAVARGSGCWSAVIRAAIRRHIRSRCAVKISSRSGRPGTAPGRAARTSASSRRASGWRASASARSVSASPYPARTAWASVAE